MKDLPIWFFWNKEIFVSQNSYGHTMVLSSFSGDYFVFVRLDQKVASHWLVSVSMNKNWIKIRKLVVCKVFKDIPSNPEDINFLMRLIFIWKFMSRLKRFRLDLELIGKAKLLIFSSAVNTLVNSKYLPIRIISYISYYLYCFTKL